MASRNPHRADLRHAPGWYAILPEPAPAKRLGGDQVADWAVVGAGVTGLAAARRLGELDPDARVLLLDECGVLSRIESWCATDSNTRGISG